MLQAHQRVGEFEIVRLLGAGGMGEVYEAEQDNPRRTVALKVVKPGLAAPELLRRFEQESQALGRLQHPGIAQIYEAGAADTGFPSTCGSSIALMASSSSASACTDDSGAARGSGGGEGNGC